ncbi:MAG: tetratricopeptide repeat protein [Ktedonobacteraceae bacterium]|nr:tetratricopeptide repeat protein [Ktedonobacteraceae bacterium]
MSRYLPYRMQEEVTRFCLGHPSHAVPAGDILCRICRTLAKDAHLGPYQIQKLLGTGRSGHAYLAAHLRSQRAVVVKCFAPDSASMDMWETAWHEVHAIVALRHKEILPVFSCVLWSPTTHHSDSRPLQELMLTYTEQEQYLLTLCQYAPYTIVQYLSHVRREANERAILAHIVNLTQRIGTVLSIAHASGIVHGALVPGNILLDAQANLWIADFGLAKLHPPPLPYLAPELYNAVSSSTHTGNMRAFWQANNPGSDQYMLSILCQQLLSHTLPTTSYEHLLSVLQRASQQQPEQRFATVEHFVQELASQPMRTTHSHTYPTAPPSGYSQSRGTPTPLDQTRAITPVPAISPRFVAERKSKQAQPLPPLHAERLERTVNYNLVASSVPARLDDWIKLGDKHFTVHDYDAAVKAYRKALELDAGVATVWLTLGDAYFATEDYQQALRSYEQALSLDPSDALAWSNRGTVLDALGRRREAVECYERARLLQID